MAAQISPQPKNQGQPYLRNPAMSHRQQEFTIIFTDLDGTLLNSAQRVSETNLSCLHKLGSKGITRVIATGRSCFSFRKTITTDFPADYLIFSSGAGVLDLRTSELLYSKNLQARDIAHISGQLSQHRADFMVHDPIPENHRFVYHRADPGNTDFNRRIVLYRDFADSVSATSPYPDTSAQIIAIFSDNIKRFTAVKRCLNGYQVTRTTSPLDARSIWMEIYPENVTKGSAAHWLCRHLNIDPRQTLGIGNDYNDIDLLDFTSHSYIVANAPDKLQQQYTKTVSNDNDGFYHAVNNAQGKQ